MPSRRTTLAGMTALLGATALPSWAAEHDPSQALLKSDGIGLAAHLSQGHFTPEALLDAAIARTEKTNAALNFVAHKAYDYARNQLRSAAPNGPLAGVPTLMKDLGIDIPGVPTENGSKLWHGHVPQRKSTLLARYEAAGLAVFGKTTTPELGLTGTTESALNGDTRNPWALSLSAGGSSGGAAVAVASGAVPFAQASDGAGSIRTPASCCGLFGLKPSRGRIPLGPERTEGWLGLSTAHAITRSVRDSALLLDISSGPELGSRYGAPGPATGTFLNAVQTPPKALKIALMLQPPSGTDVHADCLAAAHDAAALCEGLGHHVEIAAPSFDFSAINDGMLAVLSVETTLTVEAREEALGRAFKPSELEPVTRWIIDNAKTLDPTAYARANRVFQKLAIDVAAFMEDFDMVLSPTLAKPPVDLGKLSLSPTNFDDYISEVTTFGPFTAWANQTGQPSMSVPLYWNASKIPIGTMFTARYGQEATLLSLAAQLEQARPWFDRRPIIAA